MRSIEHALIELAEALYRESGERETVTVELGHEHYRALLIALSKKAHAGILSMPHGSEHEIRLAGPCPIVVRLGLGPWGGVE